MRKIAGGVYFENGFKGCNTSYVVTREGTVLIDTPMVPDEAKRWRKEIEKHGQLRYVINTEPHPDHAYGNYWFGTTVISHEKSRQALLSARIEEFKNMIPGGNTGDISLDQAYYFRLPEITFSQILTFYSGDHTFQLISMPGHTPSNLAVYVPEERVVFTGDNVVNGMMPIFLDSVPYEWLESLKRLQALDVDVIVPGHGDICDKTYLSKMIEAVQYCIDAVQSAINQGLSLEETLKQVNFADRYPLPKEGDSLGIRPRSVTRLYEVLKK